MNAFLCTASTMGDSYQQRQFFVIDGVVRWTDADSTHFLAQKWEELEMGLFSTMKDWSELHQDNLYPRFFKTEFHDTVLRQ